MALDPRAMPGIAAESDALRNRIVELREQRDKALNLLSSVFDDLVTVRKTGDEELLQDVIDLVGLKLSEFEKAATA